MSEVNWDEVTGGSYIKIEDGTPKTMLLKNWKPQTQFKDDKTGNIRPGVVFDVYEEDNKTYDETTKVEWTVTAKGALNGLAPLCKKAEAANQDSIKVTVVAVGKGTERKYSIKEV